MNIYVGNLPFMITEDKLMDLFVGFGEVSKINLITDKATGQPRGFGFVEMPTQAEAEAAITVRASMEPPLRGGPSRSASLVIGGDDSIVVSSIPSFLWVSLRRHLLHLYARARYLNNLCRLRPARLSLSWAGFPFWVSVRPLPKSGSQAIAKRRLWAQCPARQGASFSLRVILVPWNSGEAGTACPALLSPDSDTTVSHELRGSAGKTLKLPKWMAKRLIVRCEADRENSLARQSRACDDFRTVFG
jgi:hypothetical protein